MKDEHPAEDTSLRDGAIVLGVALLLYVTTNITPINTDTVFSGEAPAAILAIFIGKVNIIAIQNFFFSLQNTLAVIGVFFLAGSFWATLRIRDIHHHEHEKYKAIETEKVIESAKVIRWKGITDYVNSDNPGEWKLAILEADNMLDEILEDQGYLGESVADKLKAMSRTRISSYDDVWEAHKLRNQIAHGGAMEMDLTKKMARDAVAKFESAFKQLGYL